MAIIFSLWVECERKEEALRLAEHFNGVQCRLMSGIELEWGAGVLPVYTGTTSVEISSQNLRGWVSSPQDAVDLTEAGILLFHRLLTAPDFLYARVDTEPGYIPAGELEEYIGRIRGEPGICPFACVFSDSFAAQLAPLASIKPFRSGYVWTGYSGEFYNPLTWSADSRLSQLYRDLLSK